MRKLTDDQRKGLIQRRLAGETLAAIAESYGVSPPAIHRLVKNIKPLIPIHSRSARLTKDQIQDAIARRRNGESLDAIGKSYNVSAPAIHRATKRAGPPHGWRQHKMTKTQKSDAIERRMRGEALKAIAASYGVTSSYIHQITKKAISEKNSGPT